MKEFALFLWRWLRQQDGAKLVDWQSAELKSQEETKRGWKLFIRDRGGNAVVHTDPLGNVASVERVHTDQGTG